jgi:hypothetical protein
MSPLETVDRAKITDCAVGESNAVKVFAGSISVPDFYASGCEGEGGGRARDKPEEFGDHGAEDDAFCGEGEDGHSCWGGEFEFERTLGEERLCSCASSLPPSVDCRDKLRASGTCLVDVLQSPGSRGSSRGTGVLHACQ